MLINAVIIILREVLEASLIMGVLLALSQLNLLSRAWCIQATLLGLVGAALYAANIVVMSEMYGGIGQEIINVVLYTLIFVCILILLYSLNYQQQSKAIVLSMSGCVVVAIVREGSEIMVYIQGFLAIPQLLPTVLVGSSIGAGIGVSIGVFVYYLIVSLSSLSAIRFILLVLILIAGGMVSQATQMLLQADLLPSQLPIWDTSGIISEQSLVGQILFAMMGYEATPTMLQVIFYVLSILLTSFLAVKVVRRYQKISIV
ncbi:MAG: hypothetical protein COB62_07325 [Piscirickettsiaceae bacterium]|nr:MAG: hypothetical protein COB62_07325 [Piscirickettsiaceae bacterium]